MDEQEKSTSSEVIVNDMEMENENVCEVVQRNEIDVETGAGGEVVQRDEIDVEAGAEVVQRNEMDVEAGAGGDVPVPVSRSRQNSVEVSDHLPWENFQNFEEVDTYEEQLDRWEELLQSEFVNPNDLSLRVILEDDAKKAVETLVSNEQSDLDLNQPSTSQAVAETGRNVTKKRKYLKISNQAAPVHSKCPRCQDTCRSQVVLRTHVHLVHNQTLLYCCTRCPQKFVQAGDLRSHILSVHRESLNSSVLLNADNFYYDGMDDEMDGDNAESGGIVDDEKNESVNDNSSSPPQQDSLPVEVESGTIMSASSSNELVEEIAEVTAISQGPVTVSGQLDYNVEEAVPSTSTLNQQLVLKDANGMSDGIVEVTKVFPDEGSKLPLGWKSWYQCGKCTFRTNDTALVKQHADLHDLVKAYFDGLK